MESDILSSLKGGYPHLTEKILNLLDACSLANAELVCRQWRSYIADGRFWKKYLLSKKVTSIPNIFSWAEYSGDNESERQHTKQDWMKIHNFYQKLEDNWRSASCRQQKIVNYKVECFSMNTKKIFTAGYVENQWNIKTWNRKSLHCERNFTDGEKLQIVSMDCDDDFLVTMSIDDWHHDRGDHYYVTPGYYRFDTIGLPSVSTIFVRELQSGEVIQKILGNFSRVGSYDNIFKICVGHGLLISHQVVGELPNDRVNLVLIGHDENYIVVHRSNPPRFEIISTSSLNLTRTIDAFDDCRSAKYKDGLIVSGFPQRGTRGRSCCIIRIWDAETGLCLREIQEPDPKLYGNGYHHLVGFTTNYLITVPDLSMFKKRVIKIRDLSAAIDLHSNQTSASTVLATLKRDLDKSRCDCFIVDDFQLVYFHEQEFVVYSFAPQV
ncbi:F-box and WD repeat domain-containing 11-A-like isoform X2 [Daphnia pulex]|uniref:F-box and WD repeat domain-containing 11-A-like isoform X2 n=1 Tax=Daphnia pulex TaxID=6669 RepID=UPI001EDEC67C|nr:F-box and WD repeat domain-containing 11-A-like isoform X2 [Daphnia pulex]